MGINIDDIRRAFSKSAVTLKDGRVFLLYTDRNHVTQELYGELREILDELIEKSSRVVIDRNPRKSIRITFCGDFQESINIFLPFEKEREPLDLNNIVIDTGGESVEDFVERKMTELEAELTKSRAGLYFADKAINENLKKLWKFIYPNEVDFEMTSISLESKRLHTEFEGEAKEILLETVRLCDGVVFEVDTQAGFLEIIFIA